jgi:preprotein translocase subunit Sec63
VQRVRKVKDYYAILEISKDASEADIKKAYRKVCKNVSFNSKIRVRERVSESERES